MRRLLAVVAAIGMVAGSLAIRSRLDRREEERSTSLRLTCSTELESQCRALEESAGSGRLLVTIEAAGVTADRLAQAPEDAGLDGWLVPQPWPEMVDARRTARALPPFFARDRPVLARSPLVLVVWRERGAALGSLCGGPVSWKCLGEGAASGYWAAGGKPEWGPLEPGHGEPATDAVGLLVLGQAVSGWFGRTDLSTIDLDDDAFLRWFSALERAVRPTPTSPLELMLSAGPALYDATGTTEAETRRLLESAARRTELDLLYPSPMSTADVTLATAGTGGAATSLRKLVGGDVGKRALADGGWRVPGERNPSGAADPPPLPATNGLPPAGLLDALRERWHQATGR